MATNTYLGPLPGTPEYYAATKNAVFQGGAKYFTAQNPDTKIPVYLTRVGDEWQEVTKQEADTGDLGTSSQRFASLGPGSYNINWLTQPNLITNPNYAGGQIAFGASQGAGVEQSIQSQIPLTEEQKAQQIAQGQQATQEAQADQIQAAGLQQEQPIQPISFKQGLTPEQQASITGLVQRKPDSSQWTATDVANWNYATNNSPLPTQGGVTQPAQGGLTPQQIRELDIASQRVAQGQGTPTDQANIDYANSRFGYEPEGMSGEDFFGESPEEIAVKENLNSAGVEVPDANTNPLTQFKNIVQQLYLDQGLPGVRNQIDALSKEIQDIEDERDEEIRDINDNPWLTEGVRLRQIEKVNQKYEDKLDSRNNRFSLMQSIYETGVQEAQFLASNSLKLNMWQQEMDQNLLFKQMDLAIKQADAAAFDSGDIALETDDFGNVTAIDKQTGEVLWTQQGIGKTSTPTDKPPTQAQFTAANYASRIQSANTILEDLESQFTGKIQAGRFLPEGLKSEDRKLFEQAQRNFINAVLRRESGAAIAPSEFEQAALQYFPQPGDTEKVLANKKANRELVERNFINEAGNAFISSEITETVAEPIEIDKYLITNGFNLLKQDRPDLVPEINALREKVNSGEIKISKDSNFAKNFLEALNDIITSDFNQVGSDTKRAVSSIQLGSRLAKVNNNPGNLRYVGQAGASQGEGGFAKFKTPEAGYQALKAQIALDASRGLTLEQFINKYAPPTENDTKLYISQMIKETGANKNTKIKDINLDRLARAMAKKESSTIIA